MPLSRLQSNTFNRSSNDLGNSGSTKTIILPDNYNGMVTCTLTSNCTFTMPSPVNGYQFSLLLKQDTTGGRTASFTNVKWPNSTAPTISTTAVNMDIINFFSDGNYWYGYLGNSQNFDSYAGSGDRYFSNVALLLNMDGSGSSFLDSSISPKTITAVGSATQSSTQSKWGGKSLALDGSTAYLTVPRTGFTMTGDFVIEVWAYFSSLSIYASIIDGRSSANYLDFICGIYNIGGSLRPDFVTVGGAGARLTGNSTAVSLNTWTHIAFVRSNGVISAFINGVRDNNQITYASSITPVASNMLIGRNVDGNFINGYIDDLRVTIGSNRNYTGATITVPTAAFPTFI